LIAIPRGSRVRQFWIDSSKGPNILSLNYPCGAFFPFVPNYPALRCPQRSNGPISAFIHTPPMPHFILPPIDPGRLLQIWRSPLFSVLFLFSLSLWRKLVLSQLLWHPETHSTPGLSCPFLVLLCFLHLSYIFPPVFLRRITQNDAPFWTCRSDRNVSRSPSSPPCCLAVVLFPRL